MDMHDTQALLRQLRLDDAALPPPSPATKPAGMRRLYTGGALVALAVLATLGAQSLFATASSAPDLPANGDKAIAQAKTGTAGLDALTKPAAAPVQAGALDASGYLVASREATVSAKVTGRIMDVLVKEGDTVKAGQAIAQLDDSNARAQLALARTRLETAGVGLHARQLARDQASAELNRKKALLAAQFISAAEVERASSVLQSADAEVRAAELNIASEKRSVEAAALSVRDLRVDAPFAGVVTARLAQVGEIVAPVSGGGLTRTGIATIMDVDALEAEVEVNENYVSQLGRGQRVRLTLGPYPDWQIAGSVLTVVPNVDRGKGTVKVRLAVHDADARAIPNMSVRARFDPVVPGTGASAR